MLVTANKGVPIEIVFIPGSENDMRALDFLRNLLCLQKESFERINEITQEVYCLRKKEAVWNPSRK